VREGNHPFFIKGHSPDFITFITKSQSSTTPDQTKHRHNHPTEFKDASLPTPPPPPFEQSTKGQPKRGGEGQQPANKVTSQSLRPHRQAPGTTTNSFHKPYRTNTKTPSLLSFSSNLQQAKEIFKVFKAGLGGERNPAHCSINVPSPWSSRRKEITLKKADLPAVSASLLPPQRLRVATPSSSLAPRRSLELHQRPEKPRSSRRAYERERA
jgi:hypothetical protein